MLASDGLFHADCNHCVLLTWLHGISCETSCASSQCPKTNVWRATYQFHVPTDETMILSPSKYLKFIFANTQQVSTQEKLFRERWHLNERGHILWGKWHDSSSRKVFPKAYYSKDTNKKRKSWEYNYWEQLLGECVWRHILPAAGLRRGWATQAMKGFCVRRTGLQPSRCCVLVSWVWEGRKPQ